MYAAHVRALQSITTTENLPSVLAARSAGLIVATPLGTAIGGPIVASIGARSTLTLPAPQPSSWRRSQPWSGNETRVKCLAGRVTKPITNREARSPSRT
jgi:hypothetical protein